MHSYTSGDIGKLTGVGPWAVGTTFTSENLSKKKQHLSIAVLLLYK